MLVSSALLSATISGVAFAVTHHVKVGATGLTFEPDSLSAAPGDIVQFDFYPKNHSVAQSTYDTPCQPSSLTEGIFSGFIPSSDGQADKSFAMTVNNTASVWLYCSQSDHCQKGMVMVINPPTNGINLDAYKSASEKTTSSSSPLVVGGGVIVQNRNSSSTSLVSTSTSSTASPGGGIVVSSSSATSTAGTSTSTNNAAPRTTTPVTRFFGAALAVILGILV